jgi:excisionase family DNA binding protein
MRVSQKQWLTQAEIAEATGLTKQAVRRRIQRGTIKSQNVSGQRLIPAAELERLLKQSTGALQSGFEQMGDKAEITSDPTSELTDTDTLLRERNLDPEDWEVERITVNEWDGPSGESLKQLKVTVRRKRPMLIKPAEMPVDYKRPERPKSRDASPELVVLVGDQQAPYHDPQLHDIFCNWLAHNKPSRGVLIGDTVDFPDISRHPENPEWDKKVQECVNAGYLILRDYVQASEETDWVKLAGNHDERIRIRLLQYMTNLYDLRPADIPGSDRLPSVWSMETLLHLKSLGIDFIDPQGPYAHAQVKLNRNLAVRHGWIAKKGSGASALGTLEHLGYSVVVGHTHRQSLVHKTTHDIDSKPSTLAAVEAGCMCKIENGLGYTVAPDWQNGFATASLWPDGTFKLDLATFVGGKLYWRDQRFT